MMIQPAEIYGNVELEILRHEGKIFGFSLVAKPTASAEVKKFCGRLSDKWHSRKIHLNITEKHLVVHKTDDTMKNCWKFSLTAKDANALGTILLSKGYEVYPTQRQTKDSRFGVKVVVKGHLQIGI